MPPRRRPTRSAATVLLMADTRLPVLPTESADFSLKNLTAHGLAFYLNLKHACLHGEKFLYFHLASSACHHTLWGERHPSYCKLPAIAEALSRGHERVVFLDSDAFIRNAHTSVPSLLQRYGGDSSAAAIEFGWDSPYSLGPNAGFAVFKHVGSGVRHALRLWWNLYAGEKGMIHPYEQHALHWSLLHLRSERRRLRTLPLRAMDPSIDDAEVKHLDHNAGRKTRVWVMARAAAETLLTTGSKASRADAAAALGKWRTVLRAPRGDLKYADRVEAVHTVMQLVSSDLRAMLASKQPACVPSIEPLNASDAALRRLHWERAASSPARLGNALAGLPLTLANCSDGKSDSPFGRWQTWRLLPAKIRGTSRLSLAAVPALCVAIGATRSPRNPYQVLATLEPCAGATSTRDDAEGTDAARARTRIHVPPVTSPEAPLAASGELHFVRSGAPPETLRRLLPELRAACGFWPNCSGTTAVLPKPCWDELGENASACGTSEPAVNNLIKRTRWGGHTNADASWSRVSIGPSGPAAAAALARGAVGRLCLSTWRSKLREGSPVTFAKCPSSAYSNSSTATRQRKAHRGRWESSTAFEWLVRSTGRARVTGSSPQERAARTVHKVMLRPRSVPHLCLTAPPLPW